MRKIVEHLFHEVADLSRADRLRFFIDHKIDPNTETEVEGLVAFDYDESVAPENAIRQVAEWALIRLSSKL